MEHNFFENSNNITMDDFLTIIRNESLFGSAADGSYSMVTTDVFGNETYENATIYPGLYPSGYSITEIVIASIIVVLLMVIIVVGNMLVIIAIATEKTLKSIQHWFIASLAVADFFLGLVVMPFSLANELMGYWIFGRWWCDIYAATDVLLCTASIMNLCLISLDRYWSITKAVEYLKTRTPARAAAMIAAVWIMSGLICIPPLLGWKAKRLRDEQLPQCQLSTDLGYVLYSALGSFYIPSCIMVFVYIRIYYAAKRRARRNIKKQPRKYLKDQTTTFTNTVPMPSVPSICTDKHRAGGSEATAMQCKMQMTNVIQKPATVPIVTCDLASDVSTNDVVDPDSQSGEEMSVAPGPGGARWTSRADQHINALTPLFAATGSSENGVHGHAVGTSSLHVSPLAFARCRAFSVGIDNDMVSEFDPSSSDSGVVSRCASVKPSKFRFFNPIFRRKLETHGDDLRLPEVAEVNEMIQVLPKKQKVRDPEKEKRRIARKKEKRATLILGLIMGCFIACWLPFFFLYILIPACAKCKIPQSTFKIAFWLGYMNSALNPVIYTIFNKDFRRAFRRILFK